MRGVAEHLTRIYAHRRGWLRGAGAADARGAARPALADTSLSLERGEAIGIVGESGSGKSTLARCLALLERPDAGRVLLEGADLTRLPRRRLRRSRRRIQVVFQDPYSSLNPRLTVGSALREVLVVHDLVARDAGRSPSPRSACRLTRPGAIPPTSPAASVSGSASRGRSLPSRRC